MLKDDTQTQARIHRPVKVLQNDENARPTLQRPQVRADMFRGWGPKL